MANLKLKGVNKLFPSGTLALCNVSLELSDKEFVAVVGAEKSGKSTLLRVIAGLEEATAGEIYIGDKEVSSVSPKERDVAMIFRNDTLYPTINVFENMAFGLKLRKAPHAVVEQRVKVAAEMLGLTDVLSRKPKQLTAEQRQRVALGRAIVREPKLYLFDDPIAGLDSKLKARMRNIIINLQARMEGTFIYATKNVNEALTMATRVIVLREGVVQQIDTPANLYDYPANAYVAFYIGSPTINFINGATVEKRDEGVCVVYKDVCIPVPEKILSRFAASEEYIGTGKKVIFGIRPEDVKCAATGVLSGVVSSKAKEDDKVYADCKIAEGVSLLACCDESLSKGDSVKLDCDLEHMYLFDAETRLTILERDDGYKKTDYADADAQAMAYDEEEKLKSDLKPVAPPTKKKR